MVAHCDKAEAVKGAFEQLKNQGHRSVTSSLRVYRPWGYYQTLDQSRKFPACREF
ncbi:MAG: hypothetical protein ACK4VM_08620 [Bosea sp. (in: a-proteobacteria)]